MYLNKLLILFFCIASTQIFADCDELCKLDLKLLDRHSADAQSLFAGTRTEARNWMIKIGLETDNPIVKKAAIEALSPGLLGYMFDSPTQSATGITMIALSTKNSEVKKLAIAYLVPITQGFSFTNNKQVVDQIVKIAKSGGLVLIDSAIISLSPRPNAPPAFSRQAWNGVEELETLKREDLQKKAHAKKAAPNIHVGE